LYFYISLNKKNVNLGTFLITFMEATVTTANSEEKTWEAATISQWEQVMVN
jgi:hypothetical protein